MKANRFFLLILAFIYLSLSGFAQDHQLGNLTEKQNFGVRWASAAQLHKFSKFTPLALTLYGFVATQSSPLKQVNFEFQEEILEHHTHFRTHFDDYLQYTPLITTFTLKLAGDHGSNNFKRSFILFGTSTALMAGTVFALKRSTHMLRPDGTDYNSFPSGHTATAFAGAELLHQEFKNSSPIFSYSGYLAASATGVLRMYNNKHYFSDVLAGAGIGILSTKAAYWLSAKVFKPQQH